MEEQAEESFDPLRAGEVLVKGTRFDESGGSVRIQILINAPVEKIWNVIASCPSAYRCLDGLEECEVLVDESDRALTRQIIDAGIFSPTVKYTFETRREAYRRKDISLVEGNLKQIDAYWSFQPFESKVLVEHEVHVQPSFPVPRWLIRMKLKRDLPRMLLCVRGLSGGSPDAETEANDMAACQPETVTDQ